VIVEFLLPGRRAAFLRIFPTRGLFESSDEKQQVAIRCNAQDKDMNMVRHYAEGVDAKMASVRCAFEAIYQL